MNKNLNPVVRWPLVVACLGMVAILAACGTSGTATVAVTATPVPTDTAPLRVEDGAVKVKGEDDSWMPVAGESTFELVGEVESTDPWMVTGNTFATRETTQIADALEVGDLVRVRGVILIDNTWLANSIELAQKQRMDPALILVGKVNSIDPWVVHGITLNVTADTVISSEISPDMIVLVEILLLEDGTWEVLNIAPLTHFAEIPGCATVTATVASVSGREIQFSGWPTVMLGEGVSIEDEVGNEASLSVDQMVLVVVCAAEGEGFTITKIVVLEPGDEASSVEEKILICHKPENKGGHTLSIAEPAVLAHLAHGDKRGPCP